MMSIEENTQNKVAVIRHKVDRNYTLLDGTTKEFICARSNADDILKEIVERQAVCIEFTDEMFKRKGSGQ